jgi:serine/threonine-protein kinase
MSRAMGRCQSYNPVRGVPDRTPWEDWALHEVPDASPDCLRRIDAICGAFERAWRAAVSPESLPRLEDATTMVEPEGRVRLVYELIALERELRGAGTGSEFRARFPEIEPSVIEAAIRAGGGEVGATVAYNRVGSGQAQSAGEPGLPRFGVYELIGEVARGGMGVVYRARHAGLGRVVALKRIAAGPYASPSARERFRREAQAASRVDHPNIVPIYDVGEADGHPYFTMKLIDGPPLSRQIGAYRRRWHEIARLVAMVARAVGCAHSQGLLHRDLKPGNILIDAQGAPHVADFGLARPIEASASTLTESGDVLGTAAYMAPEQAAGRSHQLGPAADVYSLGAILYELLTGRPPIQAPTAMETLVRVLELEPEAPRQIDRMVPRPLEQVALRCLEKAPERRYSGADALADDLERYLRGEEVEAGRWRWTDGLRRWARREPELATRWAALAVVAGLTQFNRWRIPLAERREGVHWQVMFLLGLWAAISFGLHWIQKRRGTGVDAPRLAWTVCDVGVFSTLLLVLGAANGSLVVGYPLLVVTSGLWSRVRLVWLTTALSGAAYYVVHRLDMGSPLGERQYPNVVLATIFVTGFVVAYQVRRLRSISAYYDAGTGSGEEPGWSSGWRGWFGGDSG